MCCIAYSPLCIPLFFQLIILYLLHFILVYSQTVPIEIHDSAIITPSNNNSISFSISFTGGNRDRWMPLISTNNPKGFVPQECIQTTSTMTCSGGISRFLAQLYSYRQEVMNDVHNPRPVFLLVTGNFLSGGLLSRLGNGSFEGKYMYMFHPDISGVMAYEFHPELGGRWDVFLDTWRQYSQYDPQPTTFILSHIKLQYNTTSSLMTPPFIQSTALLSSKLLAQPATQCNISHSCTGGEPDIGVIAVTLDRLLSITTIVQFYDPIMIRDLPLDNVLHTEVRRLQQRERVEKRRINCRTYCDPLYIYMIDIKRGRYNYIDIDIIY